MKYRSVGKSGLKISEVALGSWVTDLKGTAAENVTKETVKLAYDSGVNFFDCADAYSGGAAERFLGEVLKQYPRKELVISSKVYFPTGEGVNDRGLSRKHIFESIDQTLKNMQIDYLDMYFCHRFDETTDLTETLRAMSDLVAQGKVLYTAFPKSGVRPASRKPSALSTATTCTQSPWFSRSTTCRIAISSMRSWAPAASSALVSPRSPHSRRVC